MFKYYIFFFLWILPLFSTEQKSVTTFYGGVESLMGSRMKTQENKGNFLIQHNTNKNFQISVEKRGARDLASLELKYNFLYFSAGHRYKPINGFYFLRDTYFYSAFQNPVHGIIQQPLVRSLFLGGLWKGWGMGGFKGVDLSERKLGIYLSSPNDIMGIAYAPETRIGFLSLNLRNTKVNSGEIESIISSQIYGSKKNNFGYFNTKIFFIPKKIELYASLMKDDKINSLQLNQDSFGSIPERIGAHARVSYNFYNRLEHFSEVYRYGRESITGGNAALFTLPIGSLCMGGRYYDKKEFQTDGLKTLYRVLSGSMSWEWKRNSEEFVVRYESRENFDRVLELKTTIRPVSDWRLEISAMKNSKNNLIRSVYEQWSDGENINTIFSDRETALKLKIIGSFVVFNLSGSRTKDGIEIFYTNLQIKTDF